MRKQKRQKRLVCPRQWGQLRKRCLAPIKAFYSEGEVTHTPDGPLIFQDNGADILVVAHLDTVQTHRHFGIVPGEPNTVYNCQLDDRLGVWLALDVFPKLGLRYDVLLTTGEERCRSTAAHFVPTKSYRWLAEFDRAGTDVVSYQYNNPDWEAAIGWETPVNYGSYSDIVELEFLGVCAANWGIGYYENHGPRSHFRVDEMEDTIERFQHFYDANKGVEYPYSGEFEESEEFEEFEEFGERWLETDEAAREVKEWREYLDLQERTYN